MTPPTDATEALKEYWLLAKCYREKITYKKISEVGEKKVHIWNFFAWKTSSSSVGQKRHDMKKEDPEKHKPGRKSSPIIRFTREMSQIIERNGAPATFCACKLSFSNCADAIRGQYRHESGRVQTISESASPETWRNTLQRCSNPQTWMDANPQTHYFNVTKRSVFILFSIHFPALFVNFKVELSFGNQGFKSDPFTNEIRNRKRTRVRSHPSKDRTRNQSKSSGQNTSSTGDGIRPLSDLYEMKSVQTWRSLVLITPWTFIAHSEHKTLQNCCNWCTKQSKQVRVSWRESHSSADFPCTNTKLRTLNHKNPISVGTTTTHARALKLFHWCYIGAIIKSQNTNLCSFEYLYQGRQKCLRISPLSWIKRMLGYGTNWPTADEMYPAVSYLQQGHWLEPHWLTSSSLISWSPRDIYLWTLSETELVLIHSVKLWREETFSKITNNDSHRS
jgi:hypothetical protein